MERRRHERYLSHQSVSLHFSRRHVAGTSVDLSHGGMLVMTASPPPLRELVSVHVPLPREGLTLDLPAMVFRVTQGFAGKEQLYGVGLQFLGMDAVEQKHWPVVLRQAALQQDAARAAHQRLVDAAAERAHVELRWESLDELIHRYASELSCGGVFIETAARLLVGTELELRVVHPRTGSVFLLDATVCRKTQSAHKDGVALRLLNPPLGWKVDFLQFVGGAVALETPAEPRSWLN